MATITGLTAERMLEIEAASVVDGDVVGNDLILARQDGTLINAGNVRGPQGVAGPMGSALQVVSGLAVGDVGIANQIRAGRQLAPSDFTNMGLAIPLGLWNLSNANDSSGNVRHLTIKGGVPFGNGINGQSFTAAVFAGSSAQVLYLVDTGAADPFRIRSGSWGCWFRTAKRSTHQWLLGKINAAGTAVGSSFDLVVRNNNFLQADVYNASSSATIFGTTDVTDDRWHFAVVTYDGSVVRLYVDGVAEAVINTTIGPLNSGASGPLNIGGYGADGSAATNFPHYGRIDEAFITEDVLSEDQIRNLYCASISHALGVAPVSVNLAVRRKRRGGPLTVADFPSQPLRLYNFVNGALTDQGSSGLTLVPQGGLTFVPVTGPDGKRKDAYNFPGTAGYYMYTADTGLPAGVSSSSMGAWIKHPGGGPSAFLGYGTVSTGERFLMVNGSNLAFQDGPNVTTGSLAGDNTWHFCVVVIDNAASDGLKVKLYLDGSLVASNTVLASTVLPGGNRFNVGARGDGSVVFTGQISRAFVSAQAFTVEQIRKLYDVSSQELAPSPKDSAPHIEALETSRLLAVFDSIETNDLANLAVMS